MRHVLSLWFVLLTCSVFSQNSNVLNVSVMVADSTGKAIKDVAIYNSKQKVIGITDSYGTATISVNYGDFVAFSHISFETLRVSVSDKSNMLIIMNEKKNMLPEVEIVENAPHLAYSNKDVWIVDYTVGEEGIFAITTTGRNSHLLHLGFEQDTLSKREISTKYEHITRDVFGNIHLIGPDSTYQVYSDRQTMHLLYGATLGKYNETFAPIATLTDSILVTKKSFYDGQEIAFFKVNLNNKKSEFLCDVYSEAKEMAKNWNRDNVRLQRILNSDLELFYSPIERPEHRAEIEENMLKRLMLKEIYAPVFNIENHVFIFDFNKNAIYKYNKVGDYEDRIEIVFHRGFRNSIEKKWCNNIIFDTSRQECYAQFLHDGIVTLKKIDLKNGNVIGTYILDAHVFPTNIQVYDGVVYYQFIDVRQTYGQDCRSLYKMTLK